MPALEIRRLDILSKILATENIILSVSNDAETASFNTKTRTLTLPNWHKFSSTLHNFLVTHEISHAKNTPAKKWIRAIEEKDESERSFFQSILNICEDPRIDKLIIREYPGTKKWYHQGIKELIDDNWFKLEKNENGEWKIAVTSINEENGEKTKVLKDIKLPDRINIYFKTNMHYDNVYDINFTEEEKYFVDKIAKSETFEDVVEVSEELYKYCKENNEYEESSGSGSDIVYIIEGEGEGEYEVEGDIEGLSGNKNQTGSESKGLKKKIKLDPNKKYVVLPRSVTNMDQKKEEASKSNNGLENNRANRLNEVFISECDVNKIIEDYVLKVDDISQSSIFYNKHKKLINYLISEFDRKKRAFEISKVEEAKTGVIDTNKIFKYKFEEDLFKRNTFTPEHKNHGFVFLIDLSSSMSNIIGKVFKQLFILAIFCKKSNIPFEVYGFTDMTRNTDHFILKGNENLSNGHLVKFLDNKMNMNKMLITFSELFDYYKHNSMGGTPLTAGLIGMRNVLENFTSINKVDICNFILLSDGDCNDGNLYDNDFIIDKKTSMRLKASQNYSSVYKSFVSPLFEIIKSRLVVNTRIIVYHLVDNYQYGRLTNIDNEIQSKLSDYSVKGFIKVKNKFNADSVYYVDPKKVFNDTNENNELFLMKQFVMSIA